MSAPGRALGVAAQLCICSLEFLTLENTGTVASQQPPSLKVTLHTHTHAYTDTHTYTPPPSSPTALQAKLITDTFVFSEIKISFILPSPWFAVRSGLVKNFIWVFHKMLWKNLNKFSFRPNQYSFRCLAVPLGPKFLESRGQIFILIFKKPKRC